MCSISVYLDKYFSDFMIHIWSLSVGLIGLDSRGQRGFVAQKNAFSWANVEFAKLFTFDKFHVRSGITKGTKYFAKKNCLTVLGIVKGEEHWRHTILPLMKITLVFKEDANSIFDFRIFEELHIACSNIWKLQLIERKVAAQKTGALWAPGGQIDSQVKMLLFFLLVFLLSIMLMMPRYHFVWTWPPWLGRHAPPGCWSARRRCSSHWWRSPRPATLHQPLPGEEVHRAQLAEWTSWLIFPTTIICQKGFWSELKSFLPADQDQDHSKDQDQGQGQGQG